MNIILEDIIERVMEHNGYAKEDLTVATCNKKDKWTPCDLILREYLNNGGGSARGFLGIEPEECEEAYDMICEYKGELIQADMINEKAWNNFGFPLWKEYDFDK